MASRATKAAKKATTLAARKPGRKSGKSLAQTKKHAAAPKRTVKAAIKTKKAEKPEKPHRTSAKAGKTPNVSQAASKTTLKRKAARNVETRPAKTSVRTTKAAPPKVKKSVPATTKAGRTAVAGKAASRTGKAKSTKPGESAKQAVKAAKAVPPRTPTASKEPSAAKAQEPQASPEARKPETVAPQAGAPGTQKKIRRAASPPPAPAVAPPGRIVAKGVPMAPEPRSPALEKQRLKEALAARELALKQESLYEKAVAQFNRRKFARALPLFEQAADGPQVALRDRARVYAQICRQRTEENKIQLRNAEDYYNYGVKLLNDRELEDAAAHLSEALRRNPKAAHAHYATAVLHALSRNNAGVYESLKKAIELDPRSRHLALHDSDLTAATRDPAIYQLLHSNVSPPPVS